MYTTTLAYALKKGTVSSQKHEMLHSRFGINYNSLDAMYRRGSIYLWSTEPEEGSTVGSSLPSKWTKADLRTRRLLHLGSIREG